MAARFEMNHSGQLKPKIHTDFLASNPRDKNALAHVSTIPKYSLEDKLK